MTAEQIIAKLRERFGRAIVSAEPATAHPHVAVDPPAWLELARFLRDEPELKFDFLRSITAVDYPAAAGAAGAAGATTPDSPGSAPPGRLVAVYDLISTAYRHAFAVKVNTARDNPHVPSVASVWPAADWHEREAFDLMGIIYDGHPNLVRILLPDDWQGHPLRKDYVFPKEYDGIPCSTEPAKTSNEP